MKKTKISEIAKEKASKLKEAAIANPKKTGYIVGGILVFFAGVFVVKKLKKTVSDSLTAEDNQDTIPGTGGTTQNSTITNQLAVNYAQQLLDAMNGTYPFYGTDEEAIESVFDKLKNSDDFLKVFKAFGNRNYNGYNSPPKSWIGQALDNYQPRNLVFWLKSEISKSYDSELYAKIKSIVEPAGFTF